MEAMSLSASQLLSSFKVGGQRVIAIRDDLNAINVFPVADSDTGNNLASLMRSINEISIESSTSIKDTLGRIADKALEGAKGNSGMIFAQYFNGLYRSYRVEDVSVTKFVDSLNSAVKDAYSSVQDPQEGTMLTVMNVWSRALQELHTQVPFIDALIKARNRAFDSLMNTSKQHKVMKQYGLVDAGAKGFYEFIDGMTDSFIGKASTDEHKSFTKYNKADNTIHMFRETPNYRYCMEVDIEMFSQDNAVKETLESMGDSLVFVKGNHHVRVHLHTNNPQHVALTLTEYGKIIRTKVDDMQQQYYDSHTNQKKIALVTDSIADISKSSIETYNIHILPLTVLVGDTEYLDKLTISNEGVFEFVTEGVGNVSTSLPSQTAILRQFEHLEQNYDAAVFVCVSSKLSGTYNAINNALSQYSGSLKVMVIDSKLNSVAQGLLVTKAGEYINEGLDLPLIVQRLEEDIQNTRIYVSVTDLKPMIRSGRIPQKLGKLLSKLGVKPIVTLDSQGLGTLTSFGLTISGNQRTIKRKVQQHKKEIDSLCVGYTSDPSAAKEWKQYFDENGIVSDDIVKTSTIIGLSAGEKATAVAVIYKGSDML